MMEVIPVASPDEAGRLVADVVTELVATKPEAVLGLATGSSPLPVYDELARRQRAGSRPTYARVQGFLLDEYVGLASDDPNRYRATIDRDLVSRLDLAGERVHAPDPDPRRLATAGERYERLIADAGGVDLQLLGIGTDGHLAFNEPGSSLSSRTRLKTLTRRTRADNARFFGDLDAVPCHVLTQGLGTIREARHLVLLAFGAAKASAVAAAVEGPVTAACPASVLQLHPHVTVLVDLDASTELSRLGYYREVYAAKPPWQRP